DPVGIHRHTGLAVASEISRRRGRRFQFQRDFAHGDFQHHCFYRLGHWLVVYGRRPLQQSEEPDPLEVMRPDIFHLLENKYYVDEIYEHTIIAFNAWFARMCDALDFWIWNGLVQLIAFGTIGLSWVSRFCDEYVVNLGFDEGCKGAVLGGKGLSRLQDGRVQNYLRVIGIAMAVLALLLIWGIGLS